MVGHLLVAVATGHVCKYWCLILCIWHPILLPPGSSNAGVGLGGWDLGRSQIEDLLHVFPVGTLVRNGLLNHRDPAVVTFFFRFDCHG